MTTSQHHTPYQLSTSLIRTQRNWMRVSWNGLMKRARWWWRRLTRRFSFFETPNACE